MINVTGVALLLSIFIKEDLRRLAYGKLPNNGVEEEQAPTMPLLGAETKENDGFKKQLEL